MKSVFKKKNINIISREVMKSQRASFRIEGMNIPKIKKSFPVVYRKALI